jgi:aspartyl-tRNA(Asn)/glutamyl-tRNA(Gln) amidotransferase subunit A
MTISILDRFRPIVDWSPAIVSRPDLSGADFDLLKAVRGNIKGLRVAYSEDWGCTAVDSEVRRVVGDAVAMFDEELGCTAELAHSDSGPDASATFVALVAADIDLSAE